MQYFCEAYDRFTTPGEYVQQLAATGLRPHIQQAYEEVPQPVGIAGSAYSGNAKPFRKECGDVIPGPFTSVKPGTQSIVVWQQ